MTETEEKDRKAFEAWLLAIQPTSRHAELVRRHPNGEYVLESVRQQLGVWQAGCDYGRPTKPSEIPGLRELLALRPTPWTVENGYVWSANNLEVIRGATLLVAAEQILPLLEFIAHAANSVVLE